MRGDPSTMISPTLQDYSPLGLIPTMANELLQRVVEAEAAGIFRWRIILDPGIGFAKSEQHSLEILRRFDELRDWPGLQGLPWLVGSSRKKFIQRITGRKANMSQYGTAATVAAAIAGGADIIRVHDVMQMSLVAKMSDAIWRHSQGFSRP
jgi:2-amino-4-hydroxy-6-hydroxymethyldihydropteridine diphosphokinase/dihydropteroate synthase